MNLLKKKVKESGIEELSSSCKHACSLFSCVSSFYFISPQVMFT